jgi:hypothetical protein
MEIRKQIDDLTLEIWGFTFIYGTIFLDSYYLGQKESKRHRNYKSLKQYSRLLGRNNTITESEVPLTDELKTEVLKQFISTIEVKKWGEKD